MNNNNFALLRYFRDMGLDAHLLLHSNDGKAGLSHFAPEADTWDFDKWKPFIHQTLIPNAPIAAFNQPLSIFFSINYFFKKLISRPKVHENDVRFVSNSYLKSLFCEYDHLLGSGIAPAMLLRIGKSIDIFSPYGTGIEYFKNTEFIAQINASSLFKKKLLKLLQLRQARGLKMARYVFDADKNISFNALNEIGIRPVSLPIPMVYDSELMPTVPPTETLKAALAIVQNSDFVLLHHSRLMWIKSSYFSEQQWAYQNKNNDAFIRAFAELVAKRPLVRSMLLLVEYGPDVEATRQLIAQLGITSHVHWLPKMARRELMWLLSKVSVGVGEFYDLPLTIWGGTGWETLASGKPLLQGFQFAEGEFDDIYGHAPPPMLAVRSTDEILIHLLDMADHPEKRESTGRAAKAWFAEHNGIGLAKKWLNYLMSNDPPIASVQP
jgi:glycosyltransferase involved in cell wall biosynthesis